MRPEPDPAKRRTPTDVFTDRARALRANETDAEAFLWSELRGRRLHGWKFRRQVPINGFIADFLCATAKLIDELDGNQHVESEYDRIRDMKLADAGYRVIRFWNHEALAEREWVLERIVGALEGRE